MEMVVAEFATPFQILSVWIKENQADSQRG